MTNSLALALRAAVAFVTESGVAELAGLLARKRGVSLELVARARDVTSPEALLRLRDELGVEVSVVIGAAAPAFHPKLWLVESERELVVMSGSGNLTRGGLITNDEQFDLARVPSPSAEAAANLVRFEYLTRNAEPLTAVQGTTVWQECRTVRRRLKQVRRELERLGKDLDRRESVPPPPVETGGVELTADDRRVIWVLVNGKAPRRLHRKVCPHNYDDNPRRLATSDHRAVCATLGRPVMSGPAEMLVSP